ncbi:MAG: type II CRISPR-associated endonuclease Cas1 [bacterium]|nr:type II CRISPR-associated endonuclease Cas1 [bacterium]
MDRILDFSTDAAWLSVSLGRLRVERKGMDDRTVPFDEIAALVVSNKAVTYTHAVLAALMDAGGVLVACDGKHLPAGIMAPLLRHHRHSERLGLQTAASLPTKKRLWQQVVRAKVANQAWLLETLHGGDAGLGAMADRVRSGDPDNVEGQAARAYFPALFADPGFRRDRDADGANSFLNYGYTVLRAIVARAVAGSGLHPAFGLHHHNRYDAFRLVDDLMEPFRPVVDRAVVAWVAAEGEGPLEPPGKRHLLNAMAGTVRVAGEERTLFDAAIRLSASLAQAFEGQHKALALPELT